MAENNGTYYAVVHRDTLELAYCGLSERSAAWAWINGTDHGQGPTEEAAIHNAWENAVRIRQGLEAAIRKTPALAGTTEQRIVTSCPA